MTGGRHQRSTLGRLPRRRIPGPALVFAIATIPGAGLRAGDAAVSADALPDFTTYVDAAASERSDAPQLAGLAIDDRESGHSIAVLAEPPDPPAIAVGMLAERLGLATRLDGTDLVIDTPLGPARLPASAQRVNGGVVYATPEALSDALASEISWDPAELLVRVRLAWPRDTPAPEAIVRPGAADIRAPAASLSSWRTESYYRRDDYGSEWTGLTDLGGTLGPGLWSARVRRDPTDGVQLQDYAWVVDRGNSRYLAGSEVVALHPLFPTVQLTGAQAAFSNLPAAVFASDLQYGQLISPRLSPVRTLRGTGPRGGTAELRIDGVVVQRTLVRLDGNWEFRDVVMPAGNGSRVEVATYSRGVGGTPDAIEDFSAEVGDQLLPRGTWVHFAGAGVEGNPLGYEIDGRANGSGAGFYQYRRGLTDRLTVEAAVQRSSHVDYAMLGAVAALGPAGTWSARAAAGERANAWEIAGDGASGPWFWRGYLAGYARGYLSGTAPRRDERNLEVGHRIGERATVSLVGRDARTEGGEDVSYLKPAFYWRPFDNLNLMARPDFDGDYIYNATWYPTPRTRAALTRYELQTQAELEQRFGRGLRLNAAILDDELFGRRESLILFRDPFGERRVGWSLGALWSEGRAGYVAGASVQLLPGLLLDAQILDDPLDDSAGYDLGTVFNLSLVADFAVSRSGLAPAYAARDFRSVGGIGGRLTSPLDSALLAGTSILVDGQPRASVERDGAYSVGGLAPGIYRIELDEEGLPIELATVSPSRWVEVRAGGITTLDLDAGVRLGFAGRIAGESASGLSVEVRDEAGAVVAEPPLNAFGYYRVDGLAPGRYSVALVRSDGTQVALLVVDLTDGFRFDQNLTLPSP